MPILTDDMKRVVNDQRLGFVATVGADGTPNLSPKGTTMTWGDALVFADIRSPQTIRNLLANSSIEINVVDPIVRKGYRFKGRARILVGGPTFDAIAAAYRDRGVQNEFEHLVIVNVERALPVTSPAYDTGASEAEVRRAWEERRR